MDLSRAAFGMRLKEARLAKGLTQDQVADYLTNLDLEPGECTRKKISQYETNRHWIPYPWLTQVAILYGRTLSWLLLGTEEERTLMGEREYNHLKRITELPSTLQEFVYLTAAMAENAKDILQPGVVSIPTAETWLDFAKALQAAQKK